MPRRKILWKVWGNFGNEARSMNIWALVIFPGLSPPRQKLRFIRHDFKSVLQGYLENCKMTRTTRSTNDPYKATPVNRSTSLHQDLKSICKQHFIKCSDVDIDQREPLVDCHFYRLNGWKWKQIQFFFNNMFRNGQYNTWTTLDDRILIHSS